MLALVRIIARFKSSKTRFKNIISDVIDCLFEHYVKSKYCYDRLISHTLIYTITVLHRNGHRVYGVKVSKDTEVGLGGAITDVEAEFVGYGFKDDDGILDLEVGKAYAGKYL